MPVFISVDKYINTDMFNPVSINNTKDNSNTVDDIIVNPYFKVCTTFQGNV